MSAIWSTALSRDQLLELRAVSGELPVAELPRVQAVTVPGSGVISVKLEFTGQDGLVLVDGQLGGQVFVLCQRCLEPVALEINNTIRLALSEADEAQSVPNDYEAVYAGADGVVLQELVEDEILLSVPLSARHRSDQCGALARQLKDMGTSQPESSTPFAGLDELLKKRN
ncbi:MAG: hypothetical protein HKN49_14375 [Gammaproteobacteria bacterium]|nr:hypothetical protein [Gammaproteobacteria bacterium]